MKKFLRRLPFVAASALGLGLWAVSAAHAALFEQQDVDQSKFIAVAVPYPQSNSYNLLILEQISGSRPCWQVKDEQGLEVDPLLLSFDFTNICGRSTDSNGYSIRQAGEDLALKYRLSIVQEQGRLVLKGMPLKSEYGRPITIGSTSALGSGFLKINLEENWHFTKRSYQGKTLGHIYLTRDVVPPEPEPEAVAATLPHETDPGDAKTSTLESTAPEVEETETTAPPQPSSKSKSEKLKAEKLKAEKLKAEKLKAEKTKDSSNSKAIASNSKANKTTLSKNPLPTLPKSPVSGAIATQVIPSNPNSTKVEPSQPSTASRMVSTLTGPVKIPVPAPESGLNPLTSPPSWSDSSGTGNINPPLLKTPLPTGKLPVPGEVAPLGRVGANEPDIFSMSDLSRLGAGGGTLAAGDPPPPPVNNFAAIQLKRYRVFATVTTSQQAESLKSLAPDAFWTYINGRSVLQLGAFSEQSKADLLLQALEQRGVKGMMDTVEY